MVKKIPIYFNTGADIKDEPIWKYQCEKCGMKDYNKAKIEKHERQCRGK